MLITLIVAILIAVICYYLITLVPDARLQKLLQVLVSVIFLIWLIGLLTGRNYLGNL
jgi:ABC-type multidrug transport system permease subunit